MSIVTDILFVVLGFIIGILFIFIATNVNVNFNQEQPLSFFNLTERPSPYDRIKSEDITLEKDKIIIKVENPVLSSYAGTKSMAFSNFPLLVQLAPEIVPLIAVPPLPLLFAAVPYPSSNFQYPTWLPTGEPPTG